MTTLTFETDAAKVTPKTRLVREEGGPQTPPSLGDMRWAHATADQDVVT